MIKGKAVYTIAPSCLLNSKDGKSRQGRASAKFIFDGFFRLCYLSSVKAKLGQGFYQERFEEVLNIVVDTPLKVGQIFDIRRRTTRPYQALFSIGMRIT